MKDFSLGEFISFIVPGSAVILGFSLASPGLGKALLGEGISIGAGGTFILLAYVVGHMAQAVGEVTGVFWWKLRKGFPTDWVRTRRLTLLPKAQMDALEGQWRSKLGLPEGGSLQDLSNNDWHSIIQQMYAAVISSGTGERLGVFTRSLLVNRGLAAAALILTIYTAGIVLVGAIADIPIRFSYEVPWFMIAATMLFFVRMEQFGKRYARELFVQFIQLPQRQDDK